MGYRLPVWTGGQGFYLSDGSSFVLARGSELLKTPPVWQPLEIRGRWQRDACGAGWLQIERLARLEKT